MNALVRRVTFPTVWLALFFSVLAFLFAIESVATRLRDWWTPPVDMTWTAEVLPDGRYYVRFRGVKHRAECDLTDIRAWGKTTSGEERLGIKREGGPALNRRHQAGPFGPSVPWILIPPPIGEPRIAAEFDCGGRTVVVDVSKG